MMPLWYKGLFCMGNPKTIVHMIGTKIEMDNLANIVPVMRIEKKASKGGFYLFLGIESPTEGQIPTPAEILLNLPFTHTPLGQVFSLKELEPMVGAEMSVQHFTRRIPYITLRQELEEDPFGQDLDKPMETGIDEDVTRRTRQYDRLLLWLSAVGSATWPTFQAACRSLGLDCETTTSRQIMRRLRLLGHIETSFDGLRWTVAPPVLAYSSYADAHNKLILCGGRDDHLMKTLGNHLHVQTVPQAYGTGPTTVWITLTRSPEATTQLTQAPIPVQIGAVESTAMQLAHVLPPLGGWLDKLQVVSGIVPHMFDVRRFDGRWFTETVFTRETGLYELWPMATAGKPAVRPKYMLFYDSIKDRWLRGDWYGLRFLARHADSEQCPVQYETTSRRLAVPDSWRWPELYERALVLASGRLPARQGQWLIYEAISPEVLSELANKLDLQCFSFR